MQKTSVCAVIVLGMLVVRPGHVVAQSHETIGPWDLYLSCRGVQAISLTKSDSLLVPVIGQVDAFCKLRLPMIGVRYSDTELETWAKVLANLPDSAALALTRKRGEEWLISRVDLLGAVTIAGAPLQFGRDSDRLSTKQKGELTRVAAEFLERLKSEPYARLHVTGYADSKSSGHDAYNQKLAARRADAVIAELVGNGIDSTNIVRDWEIVTPPDKSTEAPVARAVTFSAPSAAPSLTAPEVRQAISGGVDISTLLAGTTEFLLSEAREQVEQYVLRIGAARLCASSDWRAVLLVTCQLIPFDSLSAAEEIVRSAHDEVKSARRDSSIADQNFARAQTHSATSAGAAALAQAGRSRDSTWIRVDQARAALSRARAHLETMRVGRRHILKQEYFPGVEALRNALREDLRTLPYRVSGKALVSLASETSSTAVRDRALLALYLLRYVEEIGRAETPLNALSSAARFVVDTAKNSPVRAKLKAAAELADLLASGRADLRDYWTSGTFADSVTLYSAKAFLLNRNPASVAATANQFGTDVQRLVSTASTMQTLLASIEQNWKELRDLPSDTVTEREQRPVVIANIISGAVDLAVAVLPQDSARDRTVLDIAAPVRELTLALTDRNAPLVLNSLMELGTAVGAKQMLGDDGLRVLAFGTDVTQAQTTAQVESAFERLVSAGPGYMGKRLSTETFWRVNAYVGAGGGGELLIESKGLKRYGAFAALTLPIGVEVGKPQKGRGSHSVFVQGLDLGAIASARINRGDELKIFPKFTFGSVVAPGIFYVRSFRDSPFVWVGGVTYVPLARLTDAGEEKGGFRVNLGAAVDVPLFP